MPARVGEADPAEASAGGAAVRELAACTGGCWSPTVVPAFGRRPESCTAVMAEINPMSIDAVAGDQSSAARSTSTSTAKTSTSTCSSSTPTNSATLVVELKIGHFQPNTSANSGSTSPSSTTASLLAGHSPVTFVMGPRPEDLGR